MTRTVAMFDAYPHLYGGAQQLAHRLALALHPTGWEARVVLPADGPFADRLRADGIPVTIVAAPPALARYGGTARRGPAAAAALARLPSYTWHLAHAFAGASVVHANGPRGVLLAGPAARLRRLPLVWHLHVVTSDRIARLGAWLADEVVCVSQSARAAVPAVSARAVVEPNPAGPAATPAAPRTAAPIVVAAGRFHPDKGFDALLRAMVRVVGRCPAARLRLLGDPQLGSEAHAAELLALAADPALAGRVELPGWVERPADHWHDAAVYVQPSRPATESWGLSLAEAQASGLAVVATDVPGLRELVCHGKTGLLVPPGDEVALAAAISRLLEDRTLAGRLGDEARRRAAAAVDVATYAARWARRYERLAGLAPP